MPTLSAVLDLNTLEEYLRIKVEPLSRKSVLYGWMESNGLVSYNHGGKQMNWKVRIDRRTPTAIDPYAAEVTFASVANKVELTLPWRALALGEKIVKFDRLANKGKEQLFDIVQEMFDDMSADFLAYLPEALYADGGATGSKAIHGLQSCTYCSTASGYVGTNADTYAGKSTARAGLGGSWTGTWPAGSGSYRYHALTPLVVDSSSASWGTTDAIEDVWQQVLNFAQSYLGRLQNEKPSLCVVNTEWMRQFKDSLRTNERFVATSGSKLTALGFTTLQFQGMEIADEYACPAYKGYLLCDGAIELRSMQKQLIASEKQHDIKTSEDLSRFDFYGNLMIPSPARICEIASLTTGT